MSDTQKLTHQQEEMTHAFTFTPQFQSEMEDVPSEEIVLGSSTNQLAGDLNEDVDFMENRRQVIEGTGLELVKALKYFRLLVSENIEHSIPRVIRAGLVPILVAYMQKDDEPALQLEAAWALTNISGGDSSAAQEVVSAGAIPIFMRLLAKENADLVDQAMWALGNLAGDSPTLRDIVLAKGVVPLLVPLVNRPTTRLGLQTYAWVLSNLCGGKPLPDPDYLEPLLPVLKHLLNTSQDDQIVKDVCSSLTCLVKHGSPMIDAVLQTGIASSVVPLLSETSDVKQKAAIRLIGDILSGNEAQTQQMIDAGVIPALRNMVTMNPPRRKQGIQRLVYWSLANITAGTGAQANAVFEALSEHLPAMLRVITYGPDAMLRREAFLVLVNGFSKVSWHHIDHLMGECQFILVLCELLRAGELEWLTVALEAIHRLLTRAQREGHLDRFTDALEVSGGLDLVEQLQTHAVVTIYERSARIIRDFFLEEEDEG